MSDEQQEILDQLDGLERKVENMTAVFISCTTDILEAVKINTEHVQALGEVMALAASPTEKDLERTQTLREAFDRYEFVRKLVLGEKK